MAETSGQLAAQADGAALYFRYRDRAGRTHIVDDPNRVPATAHGLKRLVFPKTAKNDSSSLELMRFKTGLPPHAPAYVTVGLAVWLVLFVLVRPLRGLLSGLALITCLAGGTLVWGPAALQRAGLAASSSTLNQALQKASEAMRIHNASLEAVHDVAVSPAPEAQRHDKAAKQPR